MNLVVRALRRLSHHLRIIPDRHGRGPYIGRHYLKGEPPAPGVVHADHELYLHQIHLSDAADDYHNHPWEWAISLILEGGYTEFRLENGVVRQYERRPWTLNFISKTTFHRVEVDHDREVWTLFLVGRRFRDWGFLNRKGTFIPKERYLSRILSKRAS